jgi:hypothetical protein
MQDLGLGGEDLELERAQKCIQRRLDLEDREAVADAGMRTRDE